MSEYKTMLKTFSERILLVIFGCIIGFIFSEITLRLYNPFPIPNSKKLYVRNNYKIEFENVNNLRGVDSVIVVSKNKFGFRGQDYIPDNAKKMVFIGGSTTECFCISDGKDWPNLIGEKLKKYNDNIWVSNAGFSGHSTFGHIKLLDYIIEEIHPDYVLIMVGINDALLFNSNEFDKKVVSSKNTYDGILDFLVKKSHLLSTIRYVIGTKIKGKSYSNDDNVFFSKITPVKDSTVIKKIDDEYLRIVSSLNDTCYSDRIQYLIDKCIFSDIVPVFIAQTDAYGFFTSRNKTSSSDYLRVPYTSGEMVINPTYAKKINNYYNVLTQDVCNANRITFINLDSIIVADTSYFYDFIHLNNKGCEIVSDIVVSELRSFVK